MIKKTFVGRGNELTRAQEWLEKTSQGLVYITGVGGIGKTSLLRKIVEQYSADENFVVEYFDLAEQPMTKINQIIHLVDSIGQEYFSKTMEILNRFDADSEAESIFPELEMAAMYTCVQEIDEYLKFHKKKLLRLTDTFEIAFRYRHYEDDWAVGLNGKLTAIPNTIFIIAGRDTLGEEDILAKTMPMLVASFGENKILHIPLSGFNEEEADDFFAECDKHRIIPPEMREKLEILTGGRPVLLSLAVEWLQKSIPLPILIEKSLSELREIAISPDEKRKFLGKFEFELVSRVRELKTPLDIALLYMAYIDRRMDSRLLSVLLGVDDAGAEEILQELLDLPFVKEYFGSTPKKCALHDEMRELVKKHAWGHLDVIGAERRRLANMVIEEYYVPRINDLKEKKQRILGESHPMLLQNTQVRIDYQERWERWMLEAETLYYSFGMNETKGFGFFDRAFYDRENSFIRDQILLDELKRSAENKIKVALRDAEVLRRSEKFADARRIFLDVLIKDNADDDDRILACTSLGAMSENSPRVAEEYYQEALNLAVSTDDLHIQATIHNNLGRLYRSMSNLEDSITQFNKALLLFRQTGNLSLVNTTRNNLAWTYRLNGDMDKADTLCSLSIAGYRKSGQEERPLAYAYLTKADIDREKGDLHGAEKYAKLAMSIFERQEDDEGKSQSYRTLANISRHLRQYEQALRYLRSGILLVENRKSFSLLASLYQLYGRTYRHYAAYLKEDEKNTGIDRSPEVSNLYKEALQALQVSIDLAQKIGNRWEVARSQIETALIMMLNDETLEERKIYDLLEQVWKTAEDLNDPILKGYVYENRARIEIHHERYLDAGRAFGEAAYLHAKRTGLETERSFRRLNEILLDPNLIDSQAKALAKGVNERIQQEGYEKLSKLVALKGMCQQILDWDDIEVGA